MTVARLLCVVAAVLACSRCDQSVDLPQPRAGGQQAAPTTSVTEIVMKRTPCFGTCPVYTVQLQRDGAVTYTGEQNVEHVGRRVGWISAAEFARVAVFIELQGFADFEAWYRAGGTDLPTTSVSVSYEDGRSKTVADYGSSGPPSLWAIHRLLDGVLVQTRWNK